MVRSKIKPSRIKNNLQTPKDDKHKSQGKKGKDPT